MKLFEWKFKEKLAKGEKLFGTWLQIPSAMHIEACAIAGFDYIIIDNEHGYYGSEASHDLVRACEAAGIAPFIRVPNAEASAISKALDAGAVGIFVPNVATAEQATMAVKYAKYGPQGVRGVCPFVRAARYDASADFDFYGRANEETVVCIMAEGADGIKNLPEILKVEGIDIISVGPIDLSTSLGLPGQIEHPKVQAAIREIIEKCKDANITLGMFTVNAEKSKYWFEQGINFVNVLVDSTMFLNACKDMVNAAGHK